MELTHRERFDRLFKGEPVDRAPFLDYMGKCNFPSCLSRWKTEGLKADADADDVRNMMGFDYGRGYYIPVKTLVYPEFEVKVVKREGEKVYTRNAWGGLEILKEGSELMPIAIDGIVKDRYSWDAVKERLKGDAAPRLPDNFDSICEEAKNSGLPVYAGDRPAGFFGAPRELCGFENLIFMFYDDPKLLAEILETLCDLWISVFTEILKRVRLDYIFIWEDMCSKNGPLISPAMFREFLLPNYKRLTSALKTGGCEHFIVDSDGDERPLVTLWQEGGVNIVFPWESQFGLDMVGVREQYPDLGIIGGLEKHTLEFARKEMDAELAKVPYLLERGRYIPCCDHGVTNQVPWYNYQYFYEKLREMIFKYAPHSI